MIIKGICQSKGTGKGARLWRIDQRKKNQVLLKRLHRLQNDARTWPSSGRKQKRTSRSGTPKGFFCSFPLCTATFTSAQCSGMGCAEKRMTLSVCSCHCLLSPGAVKHTCKTTTEVTSGWVQMKNYPLPLKKKKKKNSFPSPDLQHCFVSKANVTHISVKGYGWELTS